MTKKLQSIKNDIQRMILLRAIKNTFTYAVLFGAILAILIGCKHYGDNNQNAIIGSWEWIMYDGATTVNGTSYFCGDGNLHHSGGVEIKDDGRLLAAYDFTESSKWKIENDYLIETPLGIRQQSNFRGDSDFIDLLKKNAVHDDLKEDKIKILHLSQKRCVFLVDYKDKTLELILYKIE